MFSYSEQMDDMDASVFSGEIIQTDLEEFKYYLTRWQRAVDRHEKLVKLDDDNSLHINT